MSKYTFAAQVGSGPANRTPERRLWRAFTRFIVAPMVAVALASVQAAAQAPAEADWNALVTAGVAAKRSTPAVERLVEEVVASTGLLPETEPFFLVGAPRTMVLPLQPAGAPGRSLALIFDLDTGVYLFLELLSPESGDLRVRLWGSGDSELQINDQGEAYLLPRAVLDDRPRLPLPLTSHGAGAPINERISVSDALSCLVRALGISLNPQNLTTLISSAACSQSNAIELGLLAFNCAGASTSPISLAGCIVGITKVISCGIANCSSSSGSCQGSINLGQQVTGQWSSSCRSTHRSGTYARFYTFRLTSTTTVRIDLESSEDAYMYLLQGTTTTGGIIESDDDDGSGFNSRIVRTLPAGSYTVEATTYSSGRTGSFRLTLQRN